MDRALDRLREALLRRGVGTAAAALSAASLSAAAVTCTSPLGIIMASTQIKIAVTVAIMAAVATPIVLQQRSLSGLRAANAGLETRIARLAAAQASVPAPAPGDLGGSSRTAEHLELLRLRGEVASLRREREKSRPAGAPKPAGDVPAPVIMAVDGEFVSAVAWADVGDATPETALQSLGAIGSGGQ